MRNILRGIASLAMLGALALPAYTCDGYVGPDGQSVRRIPKGADSAAFRPTEIAHYPLENQTPSQADFWTVMFTYGWPLVLLLLRWPRRIARRRATLAITQTLLTMWSGFAILYGWMFGKWAIGAYLVLGALSLLLGDALYDLWVVVRARRGAVSAREPTVAPMGG